MNRYCGQKMAILTILAMFVILLVETQIVNAVSLKQVVAPTPTMRPAPAQLPFPIRAPWPADIIWHAGNDGSFYGDFPHHQDDDEYAIDFNGTEKNGETIDDGRLVLAVADGRVTEVKKNVYGYGNYIIISHGQGFQSRYAHLRNPLLVQPGDWVTQGTPLGYVGKSGDTSSGEHLHFVMYYCDPNYLVYDKVIKNYKCGNNNEKIQAVRPEPFDHHGTLADGDQITSHNYGVGYEAVSGDALTNAAGLVRHDSFFQIYKTLGGHFVFGMSEVPVQSWNGSSHLYQSFEGAHNPGMPWHGMRSALFENGDIAYLLIGPVWERYSQEGGPTGSLGLPISHSYEYGYISPNSLGSPNYRNDFERASIISYGSGHTEILDASSGNWRTRIYADTDFRTLGLERNDKYIDYQWVPESLDNLRLNAHLGPAVTWEGEAGGFLTAYRIAVQAQGHAEVLVNGRRVIGIDSPDALTADDSLELGITRERIEVRFWQEFGKTARIQVTSRNLFPVPEVFASEGTLMSDALPVPTIDYPYYEAPPYPGLPPDIIPTVPVPVGESTTSTILLVDTSGSMNEPDQSGITKLEAAREAANNILEVIKAENQGVGGAANQAGLVDFNYTALVEAQLSNEISVAQVALNSLFADGGTGMPDGLKTALDLFESDTTGSKPILILLSDGMPNIGHGNNIYLDRDTVKQQVLEQATRASQLGICIYTVGFGVPGATGSLSGENSIDEDLLKQIANTAGCGSYYNAQNAVQLANIYVELRHISTGKILLSQTGQIGQGQQVDLGNVEVPINQSLLLYTLNWPGSRLTPILIDPTGRQVDNNYPGASISLSSSIASVIVENPQTGLWHTAAYGEDIPEGVIQYNAIVSTRQGAVAPATTFGPGIVIVLFALAAGSLAIYTSARSRTKTLLKVTGVPGKAAAPTLVGLSGELGGEIIRLSKSGVVIGRGLGCDLRIKERIVSRQHARLRYSHGNWYIQDLGSSTGTFVNGRMETATALRNGDRIRLGSSEFEFRG